MNFEQIKELIKLIDSSDLAFFEINTQSEHIKMDKSIQRNVESTSVKADEFTEVKSIAEPKFKENIKEKTFVEEAEPSREIENNDDFIMITSPMVGTYYSKPSPESSEFVKVGDNITKGKVICIIEAMKLMNEIESEFNGTIIEQMVKDGDMVEYGQPLFKIKEA